MAEPLRHKNSAGGDEATRPAEFIMACVVAFVAGVAATVYFCRSMCCETEMPGGWTMCMMWMRMPGQTWAASATGFLLMWLAMMVAMMLPSALPMFLNTRRPGDETEAANPAAFLTLVATGYFAIWLAVGAVIYVLGLAFAATAMRWEFFSRAVPVLAAASLLAAGAVQFTRWKMTGLLRCRVRPGCATHCAGRKAGFLLGCQQGAACCVCCTPPMMIQLALGMMNPLVMIGGAIVIAAEKLLPRPEIVSRLIGAAAIVAGVGTMTRILLTH